MDHGNGSGAVTTPVLSSSQAGPFTLSSQLGPGMLSTVSSGQSPLSSPVCNLPGGGGSAGGGGERWIWVLDPMTRKLRVPWSYLVPTQATSMPGTVPSLCIAFLDGRCRHPWCRQAHVLPSTIAQLRHDALNAPTCCFRHHDPHDTTMLTSRFQTITITDSSMTAPIPTDRIALTVGLQRYLAHAVPQDLPGPNLELPSKLICRLHLSHRCRYLEDCNNVHVCREFDLRLHPPPFMMPPLQALTMASRTVTLGDVTYAVTPLAAGEVSDEEFHHICDTQQKNSAAATAAAAHMAGSTPVCNSPNPDGFGMHGQPTGTSPVMNTPTMSFSTPPLAHGGGGTSPFSTAPIGLPSFALGNALGNSSTSQHYHTEGQAAPLPPPPPPPPPSSTVAGVSPVVSSATPGGLRNSQSTLRSPPPYGDLAAHGPPGAGGGFTVTSGVGSGSPTGSQLSQSKKVTIRVYDIRTAVAAAPQPAAAASYHHAAPAGGSSAGNTPPKTGEPPFA